MEGVGGLIETVAGTQFKETDCKTIVFTDSRTLLSVCNKHHSRTNVHRQQKQPK
jgi:hypothetical protein